MSYARTKAWREANPGTRAEEARKWRAAHPEKYAEIRARYREKNKDRVLDQDREGQKRRRERDPEGQRRRQEAFRLRREHRLETEAGRPRALVCELCDEEAKTVFDHCHATGVFRGWLCDRCNRTLGQVKDSPELLRKLANYLEKNRGEVNDEGPQGAPEVSVCAAGREKIPCS